MNEIRLSLSASALLLLAQPALAQVEPSATTGPSQSCFPACRAGYVCHPDKLECVSLCNPPCPSSDVCTEDAECLPRAPSPKPKADQRFRVGLLARFGFGGKSVLKLNAPDGISVPDEVSGTPGVTLGFDLRFEKPVARYVAVGGLISNYWLRSQRDEGLPGGVNRSNYALDISPFVKPRYPFRTGKREAEAYVIVSIGGSLVVAELFDGVTTMLKRGVFGGFNWGIAPGFQVLVTEHLGVVLEVGYARSWFKLGTAFLENTKIGQATLRIGFVFAF